MTASDPVTVGRTMRSPVPLRAVLSGNPENPGRTDVDDALPGMGNPPLGTARLITKGRH